MKIAIIGYSGAGKSTLAKKLGSLYSIEPLHLDTIHFTNDWEEMDSENFTLKLFQTLDKEHWIIDGNYFLKDQRRFDECDVLLFLNINRVTCFISSYYRFLIHRKKERSCRPPNCDEKYDWAFFKWVVKDGRSKKRKALIKAITTKHSQKCITLKSRKAINRYLKQINKARLNGDTL